MTPRKTRVRQDLNKKITTKMERISITDAVAQAALSKRGKSWASIRADVSKVLSNKDPGLSVSSNTTVAIECRVDDRLPTMQEVVSIEGSINKWLAEEVKSIYRIRYVETIGKIVILPEAQIAALFGKRVARGRKGG